MNKELLEKYIYRSLVVKREEDLIGDTDEAMKEEIKALREKLAPNFQDILDEIDFYTDEVIFATAPGSKDEDDILKEAMMLIKYACRS